MITLELFVSGSAVNSITMIQRVHRVVDEQTARGVSVVLSVVDVHQAPERALDLGIMVTPALVRWYPEPSRILIGVISETDILALIASDISI